MFPSSRATLIYPVLPFAAACSFAGWSGAATFGVSFAESTENVNTGIFALDLERSALSESWLRLRSKTMIDVSIIEGRASSGNAPDIKSERFLGSLERDTYVAPRLFVLAGAVLDHNYSQGLRLMQSYGGGLGWVAHKGERSSFELRAGLGYTNQAYADSSLNRNLVGPRFGETYTRTLPMESRLRKTPASDPPGTTRKPSSEVIQHPWQCPFTIAGASAYRAPADLSTIRHQGSTRTPSYSASARDMLSSKHLEPPYLIWAVRKCGRPQLIDP